MKRILSLILVLGIVAPAFAISDTQKVSRKCRKHPEKCEAVVTTSVQEQQMTLGNFQRNIGVGTSQADVAQILGSPNIVTQDSEGDETWIYDKVSSITSYGSSGFGVGVGGFGGGYGSGGMGGGLLNAGYSKNGGVVQTSQRTLTVVLKFDDSKNVKSFSYHMSSF
jgi:outer membrane protein assembly factor BamE (lipoprotein component of BamABCDE complex)